MNLDSKIPSGPLAQKWDKHKFDMKLVNPANKRKFDVIVVGSGLAGASAAATLAELGYKVKCFCFQDSPRRAHSIAAQGGINAAKNYQNDGDSVYRLFYDTIKGGDFRAREANVYRLAQVSVNIIDQCVAQGVPFAREYGGLLANRSFGGAQVSRTFYARGQTGQQLLLGAYQALEPADRPRHSARCFRAPRCSTWSSIDGHAKGIVVRDLVTGEISVARRRCRGAGDGRLRQCFLSFDQRQRLQCHRHLARLQERRVLRESVLHANSSDLHSGQRRSSIQTDADVRIAAQRRPGLGAETKEDCDKAPSDQIPEADRDYFLERKYPSFGNLAPRDISSRAAKEACDEGRGVGPGGLGRLSRFCGRHQTAGRRQRCANATAIFSTCMKRSPAKTPIKVPMRIYPAVHYTMGGTWVDYNLMSNVPGPVRAR